MPNSAVSHLFLGVGSGLETWEDRTNCNYPEKGTSSRGQVWRECLQENRREVKGQRGSIPEKGNRITKCTLCAMERWVRGAIMCRTKASIKCSKIEH